MIIPADKRVAPRVGVVGFRSTNSYATTSPGPTGSATMSFFCICTPRRLTVTSQYVFGRSTNSTVGGWAIGFTSANVPVVFAVNSSPAAVQVISTAGLPVGRPSLIFCTYAAGTMRVYLNGESVGTTALGAGYTTQAVALAIGSLPVGVLSAVDFIIHEAGMLNSVDLTATQDAIYAQWAEDLQQGRYLTWPRVMTVDDWYWSARDIVGANGACGPTWTDRGPNAAPMSRTGAPQSAIATPRF